MVIEHNDPTCDKVLTRILLKGGVAILKCDTIYGFTGIAPNTRDRICAIKERNKGKPFLQLFGEPGWIHTYSDINLPPEIEALWPGPLTIIIPTKDGGTLGVRVPDDIFLLKMLKHIQKPLYSTSVNREGYKPLEHIKDIISEFEEEVDIIVDSGDVIDNTASTILDMTIKPFRVLRQGNLIIPQELSR